MVWVLKVIVIHLLVVVVGLIDVDKVDRCIHCSIHLIDSGFVYSLVGSFLFMFVLLVDSLDWRVYK